jgi:hypothetical protein
MARPRWCRSNGSRNWLSKSRNFPRRFLQQLVNQRFVRFGLFRRHPPQLIQQPRRNPDRNQLLCVATRGPSRAPHTPQLLVRGFWNIREVDSAIRIGLALFSCRLPRADDANASFAIS